MASIACGHCQQPHTSVAAVKACSTNDLFACHWAVERYEGWVDEETGEAESWLVTVDCGAEAISTERGWTCAAGHQHVSMQARADEGWDYAEEYGEAMTMAMAGIEPLTMTGHIVLGPQSFAPTLTR